MFVSVENFTCVSALGNRMNTLGNDDNMKNQRSSARHALQWEGRMQKCGIAQFGLLLVLCCLVCSAEGAQQDPTRWADVIREFATAEAACPPPTNAIVFTGSSSVRFWHTVNRDMAPLPVINRGFGGSTMVDAVYWLEPLVLQYKPRAVVLYEGDNDIGMYGATAEQVLEGFNAFVSKVHAQLPEANIYFLAIKPSIQRDRFWPEMKRANHLIEVFAERQPKVHFIDIATPMLDQNGRPKADIFEADELHLNSAGYDLWTSVVRPILLEREGR